MPSGQIPHEANAPLELPSGIEIVQPTAGQLRSMSEVLALATFSNLVEILNRVKSMQERLFYIVYAHRGSYAISILYGIKRTENRSAWPEPCRIPSRHRRNLL